MRTAATGDAGEDIPRSILDEAAAWLVRLHSGDMSSEDREALERWRTRSDHHQRAWGRAERMLGGLGTLPPAASARALSRAHQLGRRRALKTLSTLAVAGMGLGGGWLSYRYWSVDLRTGAGEQRDTVLADGSQLLLAPGTRLDVEMADGLRKLRLREGQIMATVARETGERARPFVVETEHGRVRALGTRFSVRRTGSSTEVAVFEHAVSIEPSLSIAENHVVLSEGGQRSFTANAVSGAQPADVLDAAWTRGLLVAEDRPLGEVLAELERYRPGVLRWSDDIARIRVSGTFPLLDTDQSLRLLAATLPIRVEYANRYWVKVEAK